MMQISIPEDEPIARFIEAKAAETGRTPQQIAEELMREGFQANLHSLHDQFMRGEISQGRLAELLGIGRRDLIELLETLGLQVTNL